MPCTPRSVNTASAATSSVSRRLPWWYGALAGSLAARRPEAGFGRLAAMALADELMDQS
jgi:hypothetical protein